jgi:hypothetical protein
MIRGWEDPRANLDDVEKRKSLPYRDSYSNPSVFQSVASRYTDCAIPAHTLSQEEHKYRHRALQVWGWTQGWRPCSVKINTAKFYEKKTEWSNSRRSRKIWQNLLRKAMAQKGCFASDNDLHSRKVSQARYTFLRNVGGILPNYIAVQNTVLLQSLLWEPWIQLTGYCFQHSMGTKSPYRWFRWTHRGILFRKVDYSRYDAPS